LKKRDFVLGEGKKNRPAKRREKPQPFARYVSYIALSKCGEHAHCSRLRNTFTHMLNSFAGTTAGDALDISPFRYSA
jgi:hypothetical protein